MLKKFKRLGGPVVVPALSQRVIEQGEEVEVPERIASGLYADKAGWELVVDPVVEDDDADEED